MFLNPIALIPVTMKLRLLNGYSLKQHATIRLKQAITSFKVIVVMLKSDSLKHLNADDLVIQSPQVAIVLEQYVYLFPGWSLLR